MFYGYSTCFEHLLIFGDVPHYDPHYLRYKPCFTFLAFLAAVMWPWLHQLNASEWKLASEECNMTKQVLKVGSIFRCEKQWSCFVFSGISGWDPHTQHPQREQWCLCSARPEAVTSSELLHGDWCCPWLIASKPLALSRFHKLTNAL